MLEKLTIRAYSDPKFNQYVGIYTVQVNPESYSCQHTTQYSPESSTETAGCLIKYVTLNPQTISFEFLLDATGVIMPNITSVSDEIEKFKKLTYSFNGDIHSPNYLKLVWGKLQFKCRLTGLDIEYLLFSPNGAPLRAKLKVSFLEYLSEEELARRANKSSPDLTHAKIVSDGDTLPLMCHRIYGDSKYYLAVARHNRLIDFRRLTPGAEIHFPPLVD